MVNCESTLLLLSGILFHQNSMVLTCFPNVGYTLLDLTSVILLENLMRKECNLQSTCNHDRLLLDRDWSSEGKHAAGNSCKTFELVDPAHQRAQHCPLYPAYKIESHPCHPMLPSYEDEN